MTKKPKNLTPLQKKLFSMGEEEYAAFQVKLMPGIEEDQVIGVRIPILRKFAKEYAKEEESKEFLSQLPHKYHDENLLHGMLLEQIRDYDEALQAVDAFLPFVDNWAACDTMSPKVFVKHKKEFLPQIKKWAQSNETYTIRFGIKMLMALYLDEDFDPAYLKIPAAVKKDEYYVNMVIAWFYATALAKQWDETIPYLEERSLRPWIHNKTIQKAIESYRISKEQKEYLRKLKIKSEK